MTHRVNGWFQELGKDGLQNPRLLAQARLHDAFGSAFIAFLLKVSQCGVNMEMCMGL